MPHNPDEDNKRHSSLSGTSKTGKFIFANGDEYEGCYQLNAAGSVERYGTGVFRTKDGVIYSGQWLHDKMNGKGSYVHPSGCQYEGEFVNGYFQGQGKYIWPDGSFYEGEFKESKLFGKGYYIDQVKQVWTGKFQGNAATRLKFKLNM